MEHTFFVVSLSFRYVKWRIKHGTRTSSSKRRLTKQKSFRHQNSRKYNSVFTTNQQLIHSSHRLKNISDLHKLRRLEKSHPGTHKLRFLPKRRPPGKKKTADGRVRLQHILASLFRKFQTFLRNTNIIFYTFPLLKDWSLKVIIGGIPTDILE